MFDLTKVAIGFLTLLFGLASVYLIPWLKAKLGEEKLASVAGWAGLLVAAAEQMFTGEGKGAEKLRYVTEQLEAWLSARRITLDADAVRALIEAAVWDLKNELAAPAPTAVTVGTWGEVEGEA